MPRKGKRFYGGIAPRRATNEEMLRILKGEKLADFLYKHADAYCTNKPECALQTNMDIEIWEVNAKSACWNG